MNQKKIEIFISKERFKPYLLKYYWDLDKALKHYKANISISEAFYPLLAILEVSLRNTINRQLKMKYNSDEWYEHPDFINSVSSFQIKRITDRRKRKTISSKLNGIRKLRNRIFHHESISWNFEALKQYISDITESINWLDKDLLLWSEDLLRINDVLNEIQNRTYKR